MKNLILILPVLLIGVCGCHKIDNTLPNNSNNNGTGYKIEITKGDNQIDTLGKILKDAIEVKVSKNGIPLKNAFVRFETTGCDINDLNTVQATNTGIVTYLWRLNGTPGTQRLKVVLLDSLQLTKKDSAWVTANGVQPAHGWYHAACTPGADPVVNSFAKLSTGRLLAAFNSWGYPYYSDDNALNWHPLKTFPLGSGVTIAKFIVINNDEIFAATHDNGLYYSADGGKTWAIRNSGLADPRSFVDITYTHSGRLLYSSYSGGLSLSTDKGLTWKSIMTGLEPSGSYYNIQEQLNGDLYMIGTGDVYKSINGGAQWNKFVIIPGMSTKMLFIDANGDMYIGTGDAEVYKSINSGTSWTKLYTADKVPGINILLKNMSLQSNNYYFDAYGLVKTTDFKTFVKVSAPDVQQLSCYITNTNGNLVIATQQHGLYFYLP